MVLTKHGMILKTWRHGMAWHGNGDSDVNGDGKSDGNGNGDGKNKQSN